MVLCTTLRYQSKEGGSFSHCFGSKDFVVCRKESNITTEVEILKKNIYVWILLFFYRFFAYLIKYLGEDRDNKSFITMTQCYKASICFATENPCKKRSWMLWSFDWFCFYFCCSWFSFSTIHQFWAFFVVTRVTYCYVFFPFMYKKEPILY